MFRAFVRWLLSFDDAAAQQIDSQLKESTMQQKQELRLVTSEDPEDEKYEDEKYEDEDEDDTEDDDDYIDEDDEEELVNAMDEQCFSDWMGRVDAELIERFGCASAELPDICYRDLFDGGSSPMDAVEEAIARASS